MEPATESILMQIPFEIRTQILGYLLPNLSEIRVFDGYYPYAEIFNLSLLTMTCLVRRIFG